MIAFLEAHWFEILLSVLTLVLGAVLGPAIERLVLGDRSYGLEAAQGGPGFRRSCVVSGSPESKREWRTGSLVPGWASGR